MTPLIIVGGGTAGSPGMAVLTIQGVTSGTAVGVSGTVSIGNASDAGGYIRQDSNATIAKESGGNLATIAAGVTRVHAPVVTLTRPGNVTAYDANDALTDSTTASTALTFTSAVTATSGQGFVFEARLIKSTNVTTNATFRLWLYSSTPASIPNDGAAFAQAWANAPLRIGYVDFTVPVAGSDCVSYDGLLSSPNLAFDLASGTSLYGILQVLAAYTPGNAEQFQITLGVLSE